MKKIIITLLLLFSIVFMCSCESMQKQIKEETVENLVGKILGEEVDVTIVSPTKSPNESDNSNNNSTDGILDEIIENDKEGNIDWPEIIPSNVPQFDKGIESKIKTPNGVILDFGESELIKVEEYTSILKEYCYEIIREDIGEKKYDASYRKDETLVNIYWYKDGSLSLMITWE